MGEFCGNLATKIHQLKAHDPESNGLEVPHDGGGGYLFCVKPDLGEPLDPRVDPDNVPPPPADRSRKALADYLAERIIGEGGGIVGM